MFKAPFQSYTNFGGAFMLKKLTCVIISAVVLIMSTVCVFAKSYDKSSFENAEEYFALINGCSSVTLKNYDNDDVVDAIVYCGLDLSNPKIMFYLSMFYISNNIDKEKLTSDPTYSTQIVKNLNDYLANKGVENSKSDDFVKKYNSEILENKLNFPVIGAYTLKAKKTVVQKMLDDSNTDFVIVGTVFMLSQGDVNADGKINSNDVKSLQCLTAELIKSGSSLEEQFYLYSADLNGDGKININDATALQQKLTA